MYARYGTPPTMAPLAPAPPTDAQRLERLRNLYPIYCSHLDVQTLQLVLECLGDHVAAEEVKNSFNRLMAKQILGLHTAAQAICLFCVFETISHGTQAIPNLLERLRVQLTGLEARWDYMPRHYVLTNDVYNHVYGLFASCIIVDEALTPEDLAHIYRYAERNEDEEKIFKAFEDWIGQSIVVKNHGQHPAFRIAVRDTVGMWLGGAIRPQPHVLLLVMLAVEKLGGHISVADFMVNFGMEIDYDQKKLPRMDPSAPGTIMKQEVEGGGEASAQPAQAPGFLPWPRFIPQAQQQALVPGQQHNFSATAINNRVDALRRSSAPQAGTSGTLDLQSPAALQKLIAQGNALGQLGSTARPMRPLAPQGLGRPSQDPMAASEETFENETEQSPAKQEQTETSSSQPTTPKRPKRPTPRKGPASSSPASRARSSASSRQSSPSAQQPPKSGIRTSSRRRKSRGIKFEPLSDDEDLDEIGSLGVPIPEEDPNDGDFTG